MRPVSAGPWRKRQRRKVKAAVPPKWRNEFQPLWASLKVILGRFRRRRELPRTLFPLFQVSVLRLWRQVTNLP